MTLSTSMKKRCSWRLGKAATAVTNEGLVPGAKGSESIDLPLSELGVLLGRRSLGRWEIPGALQPESLCDLERRNRRADLRHAPVFRRILRRDRPVLWEFPQVPLPAIHVKVIIDPRQRKASQLSYPVAEHADQIDDVLLESKLLDASLDAELNADLEVRDVKTNQVLWTRHSLHGAAQLTTNAAPNEMVMTFDTLFAGPGQGELKAHPELMAQQRALKNPVHGFLVEVIDKHTGAYLRGVVADVPHQGWDWESALLRAAVFGDFALIQGRLDSTVVYRFSTGARLGEASAKSWPRMRPPASSA